MRRKLIVVSNRGPVSFDRDADGSRVVRRGGGGLVTALRSLVALHDVTWLASAMSDEDRRVALEAGDGSPYRFRLVAHDPQAYDWFYNVVANPTLWFLQHYLWDLKQAPRWDRGLHHAWEEGYVAVNRRFADAVVAELDREPEAEVFLHDYHLYLARSGPARRSRSSSTSRGRSRINGGCCLSRSGRRFTTVCSRTT